MVALCGTVYHLVLIYIYIQMESSREFCSGSGTVLSMGITFYLIALLTLQSHLTMKGKYDGGMRGEFIWCYVLVVLQGIAAFFATYVFALGAAMGNNPICS